MHSASLRGTDFHITFDGKVIQHSQLFSDVCKLTRLGVVAPNRVDGVGAITLIMAYVTAFYDAYRAEGNDFFAYPAFFSFQSTAPKASYSMLDIWPSHKDVVTGNDPIDKLNAINDRGVNVLLLPDGKPFDHSYERPQLESARRNIAACYLYDFEGNSAETNVTIRCAKNPLFEWGSTVFNTPTLADNSAVQALRHQWQSQHASKATLTQSFRRVSLDEALLHL